MNALGTIILLIQISLIFISLAFHEYAHGWVANKLGDPTPKYSGRLTLNPLAHIDPFGTIILPIILFLIPGVLPFGWAKPVPINPNHFRNPKKDTMWVSLSGPGSNLLIVIVMSLILKVNSLPYAFELILAWLIIINLILATLNLIPVPPLDGSKILAYFLPAKLAYNYSRFQLQGVIALIILIHLGLFQWLIFPILKGTFAFLNREALLWQLLGST